MPREASFNFIPAHQITKVQSDKSGEFKVTVYTGANKVIAFPATHDETLRLVGKRLQLFVDEGKNTIAWKVFNQGDIGDLDKTVLVSKYEYGKQVRITVSIVMALRGLKYVPGTTYKQLPVRKYRPQGYLNDNRDYYYVVLPKDAPKENS